MLARTLSLAVFASQFFENRDSGRLSARAGCPSRVVSGVDHELQYFFFAELVLAHLPDQCAYVIVEILTLEDFVAKANKGKL